MTVHDGPPILHNVISGEFLSIQNFESLQVRVQKQNTEVKCSKGRRAKITGFPPANPDFVLTSTLSFVVQWS